jgi:hypothetical protein
MFVLFPNVVKKPVINLSKNDDRKFFFFQESKYLLIVAWECFSRKLKSLEANRGYHCKDKFVVGAH